jgi:hypothetical protein
MKVQRYMRVTLLFHDSCDDSHPTRDIGVIRSEGLLRDCECSLGDRACSRWWFSELDKDCCARGQGLASPCGMA